MSLTPQVLREWFKILQILIAFILLPTWGFYLLAREWPTVLDVFYHAVVSLLLFQASWNVIHATIALRRKRFRPNDQVGLNPVPKTSFIVSAYLPNELEVLLETIHHILYNVERPSAGIEVIVGYNTPHMEELELTLRDLVAQHPELILANAYYSESKSANLNYTLDHVSGEMVVLVDADHLVQPDCLSRAWRWLEKGYDVVQGRCHVRNRKESFIASLIEVEFEIIYGIMHPAKSILFDSCLFGGSNGYWRSDVLKKIRFDETKLTEDIDSTLRALRQGHRFVHDRSIVSEELAPTSIGRLWIQRKRWAQGWFQCALTHQIALWWSPYFNLSQKLMWTTLLGWREFYDIFSTMLIPVVLAFWFYAGKSLFPMNAFVLFALAFTMLSGPYDTIVAYKNASRPRADFTRYLTYALCVWFYTIFKTLVHLVAIRDELMGERKWIISPRNQKNVMRFSSSAS